MQTLCQASPENLFEVPVDLPPLAVKKTRKVWAICFGLAVIASLAYLELAHRHPQYLNFIFIGIPIFFLVRTQQEPEIQHIRALRAWREQSHKLIEDLKVAMLAESYPVRGMKLKDSNSWVIEAVVDGHLSRCSTAAVAVDWKQSDDTAFFRRTRLADNLASFRPYDFCHDGTLKKLPVIYTTVITITCPDPLNPPPLPD